MWLLTVKHCWLKSKNKNLLIVPWWAREKICQNEKVQKNGLYCRPRHHKRVNKNQHESLQKNTYRAAVYNTKTSPSYVGDTLPVNMSLSFKWKKSLTLPATCRGLPVSQCGESKWWTAAGLLASSCQSQCRQDVILRTEERQPSTATGH